MLWTNGPCAVLSQSGAQLMTRNVIGVLETVRGVKLHAVAFRFECHVTVCSPSLPKDLLGESGVEVPAGLVSRKTGPVLGLGYTAAYPPSLLVVILVRPIPRYCVCQSWHVGGEPSGLFT